MTATASARPPVLPPAALLASVALSAGAGAAAGGRLVEVPAGSLATGSLALAQSRAAATVSERPSRVRVIRGCGRELQDGWNHERSGRPGGVKHASLAKSIPITSLCCIVSLSACATLSPRLLFDVHHNARMATSGVPSEMC